MTSRRQPYCVLICGKRSQTSRTMACTFALVLSRPLDQPRFRLSPLPLEALPEEGLLAER